MLRLWKKTEATNYHVKKVIVSGCIPMLTGLEASLLSYSETDFQVNTSHDLCTVIIAKSFPDSPVQSLFTLKQVLLS